MFYKEYIKLESIVVHKIGNKLNNENIYFSKQLLTINSELSNLLISFFTNPFKSNEYYSLYHESDLKYNEVYGYVSNIFNAHDSFFENSIKLAKHLYEQSSHPKIKGGEFYTVYFKDCIIDGETVDAVGLFKTENKDTFLNVYPFGESLEIESKQGINVNKLDKGCLIFNIENSNGYILSVVDNVNKGAEAQYWMDDFLHVRQRKDEYHKTENILFLCKNYISNELPQNFEISKADQVDFLNKSLKYLKENDNFNMEEFVNKVIRQPEIIENFNQYKKFYQQNYEVEISDCFNISEDAVKKQARSIKSVIKLDKNFHIYIHGDRELIEQGEDKKGKFYKVYYEEEH